MTPKHDSNSEVTTGGGSGKGGLFVQRYFVITRFYFHSKKKNKYNQTLIFFKVPNRIFVCFLILTCYITSKLFLKVIQWAEFSNNFCLILVGKKKIL